MSYVFLYVFVFSAKLNLCVFMSLRLLVTSFANAGPVPQDRRITPPPLPAAAPSRGGGGILLSWGIGGVGWGTPHGPTLTKSTPGIFADLHKPLITHMNFKMM